MIDTGLDFDQAAAAASSSAAMGMQKGEEANPTTWVDSPPFRTNTA